MKTIILILATLMTSQFLYVEYGPHNPVARVSTAAAVSVRWLLHSVFDVGN
jgi:hypothetical protein